MSKLSGLCPNCGSKLIYEDNEQTVMCYACDSLINVADFASGKSAASASVGGASGVAATSAIAPAMMGFDNPESGVVFMENFFETYDWVEYTFDEELEIPEITEVVNNNKMKNGAVATSWYLDYKALAVPVRKKLEGLAIIQQCIADEYDEEDNTVALRYYDIYNRICTKFLLEGVSILNRLESSIKFAERFKLEKEKLDEIKADLGELSKMMVNDVHTLKDINDVPAYAAAKKAADDVKVQAFAEKGIDAPAIYAEAMQIYENGEDKTAALPLFEKVRGYGDSVKHIANINKYLEVNDELYNCFGKYFIYKLESAEETLDVKALGKKDKNGNPQEGAKASSAKAWALYEVVGGDLKKDPVVKGIDQVIACYGGGFYFFKLNKGIYRYDVKTGEEVCIEETDAAKKGCGSKKDDGGKPANYKNEEGEYTYGVVNGGKYFYAMKQIEKEANKSKNAKSEDEEVLNPYTMMVVDMENKTIKRAVHELKQVVRVYGNYLFYKFAKTSEPVKSGCLSGKGKKEVSVKIMVLDLTTGESKQVLDEDCEMYAVHKGKVVYAHWKPNEYNKNLHTYDLETGEDVLIEKNIYKFFRVIRDKIYYTVGNETYCPLVRNSFAGDCREEIMPNIENIVDEMGGWLYVHKGRGYNSLLVKVSADGKKRVVLATQFKGLARHYGNHLYYVDVYNALHSVRIDGHERRCIAENVTKVFPTEEYLYYAREEKVADDETALSLYKMDKEGRNTRKIVFNVEYIQDEADINKIYYIQKEKDVRYKTYKPGHEKNMQYQFADTTKYYVMDKDTEEKEMVLRMIDGIHVDGKKGCGSKKNDPDLIIEEYPVPISYSHRYITVEDTVVAPAKKSTGTGCGASNGAKDGKAKK